MSRRSGTARRQARRKEHKTAIEPALTAVFPTVFGNGSSMKIDARDWPPVLLPSRGAHAAALKQEHDSRLPLLHILSTTTALPIPLSQMIGDYAWHHPPRRSRFPLQHIQCGKFSTSGDFSAMRYVEAVTFDDIGCLGYEYHFGCGEWSPLFVVVWAHPSQQMFGVVYFAIARRRTLTAGRLIVEVTDAHYPVILMSTRSRARGHGKPCIVLFPSDAPAGRPAPRFKLVKKFIPEGFHTDGGAPPYCHITPLMYPTLDASWWENQDTIGI